MAHTWVSWRGLAALLLLGTFGSAPIRCPLPLLDLWSTSRPQQLQVALGSHTTLNGRNQPLQAATGAQLRPQWTPSLPPGGPLEEPHIMVQVLFCKAKTEKICLKDSACMGPMSTQPSAATPEARVFAEQFWKAPGKRKASECNR